MNYSELLHFVAPAVLVTLAALGVLVIDLTTLRGALWKERLQVGASLAVLGCVAGIAALFLTPASTPPNYLGGMLVLSPLTTVVKVVILLLSLSTALLMLETRFTDHIGEYFAL